jgi:putative SOS response-associated peptidase YedK
MGEVERRHAPFSPRRPTTGSIRDLHNRTPVMLAKEGFEPWLGGENPTIDPSINAAVQIALVSPKMNSPRYNEPDCIEALVASA